MDQSFKSFEQHHQVHSAEIHRNILEDKLEAGLPAPEHAKELAEGASPLFEEESDKSDPSNQMLELQEPVEVAQDHQNEALRAHDYNRDDDYVEQAPAQESTVL
jgi:hypothetical protein